MARPKKNLVPAAMVFAVAMTIFYIMSGVMAVTFLVAVRWLPRGRVSVAEEVAAPAVGTAPTA